MNRQTAVAMLATPTPDLYEQACAVAGLVPPQSEADARRFATRCINGAREKADLFARSHVNAIPQTKALDVVAAMCWFADWQDMNAYAEMFPKLSAEERRRRPQSYRLAIGAWSLSGEQLVVPVVLGILGYQVSFLNEFDQPGLAEPLVRRVMYRDGTETRGNTDGYSADHVQFIMCDDIGWQPPRFILAMLEQVPIAKGRRTTWPSLASMTVAELLEMKTANVDCEAGFGYRAWEHCVAAMQDPLEHWANTPQGWDDSPESSEWRERKRLVKTMGTRMACREVVERVLRPLSTVPVLQALQRQRGEAGFYTNLYGGTPENIESGVREMYRLDEGDSSLRRLAFRQPLGGFLFSMFRRRHEYFDSPLGTFHEAEAVLHNDRDELVAKVGLALSCMRDEATLEDLVSHFDGPNESDLLEVAWSVVEEVAVGRCRAGDWRRVLIVRDWEVREEDRGRGLGALLLKQALKIGFRGLPGPLSIAARVWPAQFPVPPLYGGVGEALPELRNPGLALRRYWSSSIVASGVLPPKVSTSVDVRYNPLFHAGGAHWELVGLGAMNQRAIEVSRRRSPRSPRGKPLSVREAKS